MSGRRQNANFHSSPAVLEARAALPEMPAAHFRKTR